MYKKVVCLSFLASSLLFAENVVKLNETVVSTENFETKVRDTPANVSIVTAEDIQNTGATTLVDALRNVPGLYTREYQNGEVRFDLRGQNAMYANKNVIVTVDGVPLNSVGRSSTGSYMLSQIPIETIERIEVIPNGGGVMYGNGAVGGMVNIITKSSKSQVSYGHLSAKAGSHDLFNEHVSYGTMLGDRILTEVSVTQHNNKTFRENEKIDRFNTRFLGKYFLDDGEVEFKYNYSKGKTRIAGGTVPYYKPFDMKKSVTRKKYDYQDFYGKYRKNITDNLELLVYGNYVHNDTSPYSNKYKKYYTNELKERKNYFKTQLKYTYLPESYFIVGSDYMKHSEEDSSQRNITRTSDAKATNEMYGFYVINKYTYDKFQFTQGVRRDYNKYDFYYKKLTNVIPENKWYTRDNKKFKNTSLN